MLIIIKLHVHKIKVTTIKWFDKTISHHLLAIDLADVIIIKNVNWTTIFEDTLLGRIVRSFKGDFHFF